MAFTLTCMWVTIATLKHKQKNSTKSLRRRAKFSDNFNVSRMLHIKKDTIEIQPFRPTIIT